MDSREFFDLKVRGGQCVDRRGCSMFVAELHLYELQVVSELRQEVSRVRATQRVKVQAGGEPELIQSVNSVITCENT